MSDSTHVTTHVSWDGPDDADDNTVYVLLFTASRKEPTLQLETKGKTYIDTLLLWQEKYHLEVFIKIGDHTYSRHSAFDFVTPDEFE